MSKKARLFPELLSQNMRRVVTDNERITNMICSLDINIATENYDDSQEIIQQLYAALRQLDTDLDAINSELDSIIC